MQEHQVPVVLEFILERVTNIAMGAEIDGVNEFEDVLCLDPSLTLESGWVSMNDGAEQGLVAEPEEDHHLSPPPLTPPVLKAGHQRRTHASGDDRKASSGDGSGKCRSGLNDSLRRKDCLAPCDGGAPGC